MAGELRPQPGDAQQANDHFTEMLESGRQNPLTCIPDAYTLAATQEHNANELDRIMIRHFLNTLAEVAMSIASRKVIG
jgi:hypothetical protein